MRIQHTVQVTSFGGSGTTALLDHFRDAGVDVPRTPGSAPFKHLRTPPRASEAPAGFRVVYPFADPRAAVVSVFRRGYQDGHYRGMRFEAPPPDVAGRLSSLERFLKGRIDEFKVEDHFTGWLKREPRSYPVLFVRYEDLAQVWPAVQEFAGLPADRPALRVRPRESAWTTLPWRMRRWLNQMYGDFADELAERPSVEIA